MDKYVVCPKCNLNGDKLKTEDNHWKCIRCNYLFHITIQMYREALVIYLKHAYPNTMDNFQSIRDTKYAWLDHPEYWEDGIPADARFGCYVNPHMKLRIRKDCFIVDKNNIGDSFERRDLCQQIKARIEAEWERYHLPILK